MAKKQEYYEVTASFNGDFKTFVMASSESEAAELAELFVKVFCEKINKKYNTEVDSLRLEVDRVRVNLNQTIGIF